MNLEDIYRLLRSEHVQELTNYKPGTWVYVEAPDHDEIDFLVKNGFTQKNPFDLTVPLYSPKSTSTTEPLGLT